MRVILIALLGIFLMLSGTRTVLGYTNPLTEMDLLQGFVGTHVAADYDANEGDPVFAIANGRVCFYKPDGDKMGGWDCGNGGVDGEALFIRHQKPDGSSFIAEYGHIKNVPANFAAVITYRENGPIVEEGMQVAQVAKYAPCADCSARCDHLHLAIWDSEEPMPMRGWGYGPACPISPEECWVDPVPFLSGAGTPSQQTYSLTYVSQSPRDPSGVLALRPLETIADTNCWIDVAVGTNSASISQDTASPYYVELRSVDATWTNTAVSPLQGPDWTSWWQITPANADAGPGQTARFGFRIQTPGELTQEPIVLRVRLFHPHTGQYIGPTGWTIPVEVKPYCNLAYNEQATGGANRLWKTIIVNMPSEDRVTVFVTGEAFYTSGGDDSDLKLRINGADLGWNTEKSLDGATLGRDLKTIATTHDFVQGQNTIQITNDQRPTLYNVLVVPYHPWLIADVRGATIQAPGQSNGEDYRWFTHRFYVHVQDTYTVTITGLAGHIGNPNDDDDARFVLAGTNYGWNTPRSLNGNEQQGRSKTFALQKTLASGWQTLQVYADRRPRISAIRIERGTGSIATKAIRMDGQEHDAVTRPTPSLTASPNPFNPTVQLTYAVGNEGTVELNVYDVAGRFVEQILHKHQRPGTYVRVWTARGTSSGIYFVRLTINPAPNGAGAGTSTTTKRVTLLK